MLSNLAGLHAVSIGEHGELTSARDPSSLRADSRLCPSLAVIMTIVGQRHSYQSHPCADVLPFLIRSSCTFTE